MSVADKCQYNGYNDFHQKETEKLKRAELEQQREDRESARKLKI